MLKNKTDNHKEVQASRVVLVEKTNPYLVKSLNQLTRVSHFSTTIIPLADKSVLVYQESKKAAYNIFGTTNIILARITILERIITNRSIFNIKPQFELNYNLYSISTTNKVLFVNGVQFSMSMLVAIPTSAKSNFIKACMRCKELGFHHQDVDLPQESHMEHFPVWKIPSRFLQNDLETGRFLEEFDSKKYPYGCGRILQNSEKDNISLFRSWVAFYDRGLWNTVTNINQNLNKDLNKL
jgi:hypothetical protein